LLSRFDRTWSRDYHNFRASDADTGHLNYRRLGTSLPTHQFEGLGNRHNVVDSGRHRECLDFMASASASDRRNYSALGPTGDVRLKPGFADALNDVFNLLGSGAVRHVHDHGCGLSDLNPTKEKAAIKSRLWWNPELSFFL
jgi:hypothetical protein